MSALIAIGSAFGDVRQTRGMSHRAIGSSDAWQRALVAARRVAATEATVLLQGESGTGKEVLARFIHLQSARSGGRFVAVNCAALPEQLLESELFGYERGAFTGAQQSKAGLIEQASGGVLFLDEVSEMSLAAQAKFLRFLQEREFQRLGATRPQQANVRMIAATNRNLRDAVAKGTFREDLFYRLQVFDIVLPPLRERMADIAPLAEHFLKDISIVTGRRHVLTADASDVLMAHSWPGNARELRNVLERAAILSDDAIEPQHLNLAAAPVASTSNELAALERQRIETVLLETDGNKSKTARRLGVSRAKLYARLRRYGLDAAATA